jgi:bacteriorhodopsin
MLWLIRVLGDDADTSRWTIWAFGLVASIMALYMVAITTTLVLRAKQPSLGRLLTKALNIVFLVTAFPVGTALGIYGLWKVDRA